MCVCGCPCTLRLCLQRDLSSSSPNEKWLPPRSAFCTSMHIQRGVLQGFGCNILLRQTTDYGNQTPCCDPKALRHFSPSACYDFTSLLSPLLGPLQPHWSPRCSSNTSSVAPTWGPPHTAVLLPETVFPRTAAGVLPYSQLSAQVPLQGGLFPSSHLK